MRKSKTINSLRRSLTALAMVLTLAWLTVSLPYVNEARQQWLQLCADSTPAASDDNPFSGTTEEKNESGASLLSEYLHEAPVMEHSFLTVPVFYKCHATALYLAYHPELLLPPPDAC